MALPRVFGPSRKLTVEADLGDVLFTERAAAALDLQIPDQDQTQWCWAAVATAVGRYYGKQVGTQCQFADSMLGRADCCTNGTSVACNKQWYLHKALAALECYSHYDDQAFDVAAVGQEIGEQRPVCLRVRLMSGSGHFVALSALSVDAAGVTLLTLQDPFGPATETMPPARLSGGYGPNKGVWTHTFFTVRPEDQALAGGAATTWANDADDPDMLGG